MPTEALLKDLLAEAPFAHWLGAEWISLPNGSSPALKAYEDWIDKGYQGEMDYLARHLALKKDPELLLPGVRSLIVVTKAYVPADQPHEKLPGLRLAAYAKGLDYHEVFGGELKDLASRLQNRFPRENFRAGTDSLPILERDLARAAGLGWVGKNTCLIHPKKGSFFFIGVILSTVLVQNELQELPDFCGTCTRCMEACPTQAFEAPRELNATKCISYWTIEAKKIAPPELSKNFGDWFFGCDICQSVCPWNQKPFRGQSVLVSDEIRSPQSEIEKSQSLQDLKFILTTPESELRSHLKGTPLSRAKAVGLRRNALFVIENAGFTKLLPAVEALQTDAELGSLATRVATSLKQRPIS